MALDILLKYWHYIAVLVVLLAAVLWFRNIVNNAYDKGYADAVTVQKLLNEKHRQQVRDVVQQQTKTLVQEQGRQQEELKIITREVIQYVEKQGDNPAAGKCVVDPEFVRLWNSAATSTPFAGVQSATVTEVPK
jgi:uncharacterized membrane protein